MSNPSDEPQAQPELQAPPPSQIAVSQHISSLVLASRSPRRQSMLRDAGYEFVVDPADIDEDDYPAEVMPADLALRLARMKSHAVSARRKEEVILAADTIVAFGDRILNKPRDENHAREMLRLLSGTTHVVITGVSVICRSTGFSEERRVMSAVRMRMLSKRDIEIYVESGGWRDKAGGYGIQDNDPFVQRLSGCYTNIVGLPMKSAKAMLASAGIMPKSEVQ